MSANKLDEAAAAAGKQAKAAFEDYRQRMWAGHYPYPPMRSAAAAPAPAMTLSLVESIGTLLRVGVDFLNAGLRAGTELLGGMAGAPQAMHPMGGPQFGGGCHCGGGHEHGHDHDQGHDHGHHCLYGGHCCDCCHPGVHNCC